MCSIPSRTCASTLGPEAGAQCISSARWDLCGGPPERAVPTAINVEAEGSSPFTSTKDPGQRAEVGSPEGHKAPLSATWCVVEVDGASWPHSPKNQVTRRRPDLRHGGMCDWAPCVFTCLYGQTGRPVTRKFATPRALFANTKLVGEWESASLPFALCTSARPISERQDEPSQNPGRITLRSRPGIVAIWPQCVRS